MQCPKCERYQDLDSAGPCKFCGGFNWEVVPAAAGGRMISCVKCERGPKAVPCLKCGEPILGKWLLEDEYHPPSKPPKRELLIREKIFWFFAVILILNILGWAVIKIFGL
jgi:hypothetical protein